MMSAKDTTSKTGKRSGSTPARRVRDDAEGQFVRRRKGGDPEGLDSANPVVLSGDGDATDEIRSPERTRKR